MPLVDVIGYSFVAIIYVFLAVCLINDYMVQKCKSQEWKDLFNKYFVPYRGIIETTLGVLSAVFLALNAIGWDNVLSFIFGYLNEISEVWNNGY